MSGVESKAAAKARLQAEGHWRQAVRHRESKKAQGMSPAEAHASMVVAFPPLATSGQPSDASAPPIIPGSAPDAISEAHAKRRRRRGKRGPLDLRTDVVWCYLNMHEEPDTLAAPNGGALALLTWARANPGEFLKTFMAKLLSSGTKPPKEKPQEEEGEDPSLEMLRRAMAGSDEQQPTERAPVGASGPSQPHAGP
jgi:hypothetical protein